MVEIRLPRVADATPCVFLAAEAVGEARAPALVRAHFERHQLLVADADNEVVGLCAWRSDWFQCTFVTLVVVREDHRRQGIARRFFEAVEAVSPGPRLFSSTEETNAASIRMHRAFGFQPSGHIDNLPQGHRELLFYKAIQPRLLGRDPGGPA
jgi:GNAT superfamily N-acetyltransferase